MTYNPFETKRRNEMIARLEKERNTFKDSAKELRKEVESLRQERDMLRLACDYSEKLIAKLQDCQPKWIKINSEADLPKEYGYYWFRWQSITGKVTIKIYSVDNRGINTPVEPTHYAPITKPQPPKED